MKTVIAILALLAIASATDMMSEFNSFTRKHNKIYGKEEFAHRFEIFKKNMERMNNPWEGVTKFMDLTPEEFSHLYLSKMVPQKANKVAASLKLSIPSSYDWRDQGAVTPVKDQGQCGSCWAFSTTGNVEGRWKLAGHSLPSLSEQNLVDCDKLDSGCNGGLPSNAYQYIISNGIDTEKCYPYKAYDQSCKFDASCATAQISSWESVSQDEDQIAQYLYSNGPVSIGINAGWMQVYSGGIADPSGCSPQEIDHGVLIVGYGEENGKKFWIIKNSWGADWGEEGYCRIIRGKALCGLNLMVTSAIV